MYQEYFFILKYWEFSFFVLKMIILGGSLVLFTCCDQKRLSFGEILSENANLKTGIPTSYLGTLVHLILKYSSKYSLNIEKGNCWFWSN